MLVGPATGSEGCGQSVVCTPQIQLPVLSTTGFDDYGGDRKDFDSDADFLDGFFQILNIQWAGYSAAVLSNSEYDDEDDDDGVIYYKTSSHNEGYSKLDAEWVVSHSMCDGDDDFHPLIWFDSETIFDVKWHCKEEHFLENTVDLRQQQNRGNPHRIFGQAQVSLLVTIEIEVVVR